MSNATEKKTTVKKGDEFWYMAAAGRDGQYYYRRVRVRSCGQKRMHLIDADTNEDLGSNFVPALAGVELHARDDYLWAPAYYFGDDVVRAATLRSAWYQAREVAQIERQIASADPTSPYTPGYVSSMRHKIAKIEAAGPGARTLAEFVAELRAKRDA